MDDVGLINVANDSAGSDPETWWGSRRFRYNVGLLIAGPLAFLGYVAVGEWCIRRNAVDDLFEITIFTTFFQAVGYFLMMGVANVLYYLGPLSEKLVRPNNLASFRKRVFRLAFWFSVSLPFLIPLLLFLQCNRARAPH
jgi:hypothetical protein